MKEWILFILKINAKLEKLCNSIERRIEKKSLNATEPITKTLDEIFALNEHKIRLINLRVLYNYIKKNLNDEEFAYMWSWVHEDYFCVRSTFYRRLNRIMNKCIKLLARLGYNSEKFEQEYPGYAKKIMLRSERPTWQCDISFASRYVY